MYFHIKLPILIFRLEEKLSDMETEDQILRQQTLLNSSSRRMSEHLAISTAEVEMVQKNVYLYMYFFPPFSHIDLSENVLLIFF